MKQQLDSWDTVATWLNACDANNINPWEYDLKQEIYDHLDTRDTGVRRVLSAWAGHYWAASYRPDNQATVETEDCTLMQCIYQVLWGCQSKYATALLSENNQRLDADIMNSFWSPYKKCLIKAGLKPQNTLTNNGEYQKFADAQELLDKANQLEYAKINEKFNRFADLTHTIGNCTLEPLNFNKNGRYDWGNTWSEALPKMPIESSPLQKILQPVVEKARATQPKANPDALYLKAYNKVFLMTYYKTVLSYDDDKFLKDTVDAITNRGKRMTALLRDKISKHQQSSNTIDNQ